MKVLYHIFYLQESCNTFRSINYSENLTSSKPRVAINALFDITAALDSIKCESIVTGKDASVSVHTRVEYVATTLVSE